MNSFKKIGESFIALEDLGKSLGKQLQAVDLNLLLPECEKLEHKKWEPDPKIFEELNKTREEQRQREIENNEYLKEISKNTAYIKELVSLIQNSNEQQQDVIQLLSEMLQIAAAKNPEDAKSTFRKVINHAESIIKDVETLGKIYTFGIIILQGLK